MLPTCQLHRGLHLEVRAGETPTRHPAAQYRAAADAASQSFKHLTYTKF